MKKRIFICLILIINIFAMSAIQGFAHPQMLNVGYDICDGSVNENGIDEMWYVLNDKEKCEHLSHENTTIKYYFSEYSRGNANATWINLIRNIVPSYVSTDTIEDIVSDIKEAYAESMEKWNNVYFYTYDSSGNVVKNRVINVTQVFTDAEANLTIYPVSNTDNPAGTIPLISASTTVETEDVSHKHCSCWIMNIDVKWFYDYISLIEENVFTGYEYKDAETVKLIRKAAGTHEIGHILGLQDVDLLCGSTVTNEEHHLEVLMGYGDPIYNRCPDITYKDIAGVAITRGFHTDADHKWLKMEEVYTDVNKLVCSICNGVVYQHESSGYIYDIYGECNGEHDIQSGNMMAVASYGTKDYYKCKYCRYVAPFDDIVEQNYVYSSVSSTQHQCTNEVDGLRYSFLEAHTYGRYFTPNNKLFHNSHCDCGQPITQRHVISPNDVGQTNQWCKYCGELLIGSGTLNGVYTDYPHTENGSYILPSGVIVLVPEDEEAYLNGTLEFRTGEIM